jgi:hypothetical protein
MTDIKPHDNNKEIYKISTLLNTRVQSVAPQAKREFPPCMRCQKFEHTKKILQKQPKMRKMCSRAFN